MQSYMCSLRAECTRQDVRSPRKAVGASPGRRQQITLQLPGKGQNADIPLGSANEPQRLMRMVQYPG